MAASTEGLPQVGGLIRAKLKKPRLRDNHLRRPRLTSVLNARTVPLVVASAPAGFGKTVAVVDWLDELDRPVAWYSIDRHDDDPVAFFSYLASAIEPLRGEGRLRGLLSTPAHIDARMLAAAFGEDLAAAPDDSLVVLEDLHDVTDPVIGSVIQQVVAGLGDGMTLVITSRADPPLPLARLRADSKLIELRSSDLAFTEDEGRELLRRQAGIDLDPAAFRRLNVRIEGWAVGLQLAALSLSGRTDFEHFVRNHRTFRHLRAFLHKVTFVRKDVLVHGDQVILTLAGVWIGDGDLTLATNRARHRINDSVNLGDLGRIFRLPRFEEFRHPW